MHRRRGERGFALIGAMWLLVLGSAIVALLMLRARHQGREAKAEAAALIEQEALTGAVHTIAAELLLLGPNSLWSRSPVQGSLEVDGTTVSAMLTSEEGRLDLNQAAPARIDGALRQLQVDAAARQAFIAQTLRDRPLGSLLDVDALAGSIDAKTCLLDKFTTYAGLAEPKQDQASAPALEGGGAGLNIAATPQALGVPLRLVATAPSGKTLTAVFRVTPSATQPLSVLLWQWRRLC